MIFLNFLVVFALLNRRSKSLLLNLKHHLMSSNTALKASTPSVLENCDLELSCWEQFSEACLQQYPYIRSIKFSINNKSGVSTLEESTIQKVKLVNIVSIGARMISKTPNYKESFNDGLLYCQFKFKYKTNEFVKNYKKEQLLSIIKDLFDTGKFKKAIVNTNNESIEMIYSSTGQHKLKRTKTKQQNSTTSKTIIPSEFDSIESHDRQKNLPIPLDSAFLKELKLILANGKVKSGATNKINQIQKFVEIMSSLVESYRLRFNIVDVKQLTIIDLACGLGYLTFGCHQYFSERFQVQTTGVEIRPQLVDEMTSIKKNLSPTFNHLNFVQGDIIDFDISNIANKSESNNISVLIALHACDTATDDVIFKGICADVDIIALSPCCHKELRTQIDNYAKSAKHHAISTRKLVPTGDLSTQNTFSLATSSILEYGIYRERITEIVTDQIRATLLKLAGYETNIIEFIDTSATSKNAMITAVKSKSKNSSERQKHLVSKLKSLYKTFNVDRHALLNHFLSHASLRLLVEEIESD